MKRVDGSGSSFAGMRGNGGYYVDKTMLIADILGTNHRGVYLFTRPMGFGKTTNLSMLDAFFNIEYRGNDWFDGLEISEHHEFDKYRNSYPVICIDMGPCKETTYESFIIMFKAIIRDTFHRHRYLLDSDSTMSRLRRFFDSLDDHSISEDNLKVSIKELSKELTRYHGMKPVILIDDYDSAVAASFGCSDNHRIMDFIGSFMYVTIKGNENRQMVYVTGVMQVGKGGTFSDLNDIMVNSIFSLRSDHRFGFTDLEVRGLLSHYGRLDEYEMVGDWYGGYRFGYAEVYNPYSIMRHVGSGVGPKPYWSNIESNWTMDRIFDGIGASVLSQISSLTDGDPVDVRLDGDMTYDDLGNMVGSLLSMMTMSGYLKAVPKGDGVFAVSIPNKDVMSSIMDMNESSNSS